MKMTIYGKQGGRFTNDEGSQIEYRKIYAVKPSGYVDQQFTNDRVVVGGEADGYRCSQVVFDTLPNDAKAYEKGLICNVEFDDRKRIVDISIAD